MKIVYNGIVCSIKVPGTASVPIADLCPEAVSYAVMRMFSKNHSLSGRYVMESCAMRFSSGKARRARTYCRILPAAAAEINADHLRIEFTVDVDGISVTSIRPVRKPTR